MNKLSLTATVITIAVAGIAFSGCDRKQDSATAAAPVAQKNPAPDSGASAMPPPSDSQPPPSDSQPSTAAAAMSEGEVRNIDKAAGKITIKHGPLVNLGMPGMTMAFRVQDPTMLDKIAVGDKIRFIADKVNEDFVVTKLEAAK